MQNFVCILLFCFSSQIDLKIHVDETWQQWHVLYIFYYLFFLLCLVCLIACFMSLVCQ